MKLIVFANLTFFMGCTLNSPNNTFDSNKVISINKPNVLYEVKKLPEKINIFLSNNKGVNEQEFINGLFKNYYYTKNQINYSPDINFITKQELDKSKCSLSLKSNDFSIILLTNSFFKNLEASCISKILKLRGLLLNLTNHSLPSPLESKVLNLHKYEEYVDLLSYAKFKGSSNALIIDDENTLDKNILSEIWLELEGNVLNASTSKGKKNQNLITSILLIESSKIRSRKVSRVLSTNLESIPRRRMDIDSIILSVSLEEARSLKPELEYNFGESLSVYLIPNWGKKDYYQNKELDLEGVSVIDLPWMFNTNISYLNHLPEIRNRFFAFGYDSYDIALLLNNPRSSRQFNYLAMSGEIIYKNGNLSRKSLKTEIKGGSFQLIDY